ncbi:H-NS histone family protein [Leptothrix discophora]|uniref:H-NS histone family protein n=1 Tax=Leptothrix discophora TaxID=89 RepID=A0ABT9G1T6_LEPDI|nr:H-NS histone family protein [Leptothrix discophora]MDP4300454.1 H-NS histone family protein [Leptothrix discophora]
MATYQELLAQREAIERQQAELEQQIADTLKGERDGVIGQIKGLMAEHGITVADLTRAVGRNPRASSADASVRKVAPKFRDPSTGDTWSGRGLKPRWLTAALDAGRKLEDFAV